MIPCSAGIATLSLTLCVMLAGGQQRTTTQTVSSAAPEFLWQSNVANELYQNPILPLDYSDPDVVAVGQDYYMTASSFNAAPGLPILHSTDLVNWQLINYALPQQFPVTHFATPQHGNGVWAPNIRFHDGLFWIFYPDPDFGIYVTTAKDPKGDWSEPKLILAGKGLIDPTPLWDDDGQAWLLHAWAKSRAGFNNVLSLRKMASDASRVSEQYEHVIDGNQLPGYRTLEGPKFYKRHGYYYIFAPAGGVETGWQSVFRAKQIQGPYEHRQVLHQGNTLINGPHQGAWVHTSENEDWFIHFQSRKAFGRIVHLQPMTWKNHWPVIGFTPSQDVVGEPVYRYRKPKTRILGIPFPQPSSDEFNQKTLGLQWQWNANSQPHWYQLEPQNSTLTLFGQPRIDNTGKNLWMTPSLLLQKNPALNYEVITQIDLNRSSDNAKGGLLLFGEDYAWIGIHPVQGKSHLVYVQCKGARVGCDEHLQDYGEINSGALELRYIMNSDATVIFSYRTSPNDSFTVIGEQFKAVRGRWVGAKVGLFNVLEQSSGNSQLVFDYIRFLPQPRDR
ncbi:glycoside hydrolase family 43 protein [Aliiglaciecola lipolytica]|uniref:Glycoside hydrolase family 43 n=1 Tax=Aliiglaciecola lipolytica E3 TaxID=1127673 RepID=K6YCW0_9ALTE|nr:glycoside hydrolase 43 family protein [Aliiglaciecola lipolytica]GAC14468.1 glycoside hydrolase family 43 [Aliiglaciecola lipolytica E3]